MWMKGRERRLAAFRSMARMEGGFYSLLKLDLGWRNASSAAIKPFSKV
jgi:hypothetical protein